MAMDGREASNANQGFRGVFLTDLPGIDGGGEVWLFAAFTHGRVIFLASLFRFRFRFSRMVLAKRVIATGSKYLLGGFIEGGPPL
jgi:hypothetical protein